MNKICHILKLYFYLLFFGLLIGGINIIIPFSRKNLIIKSCYRIIEMHLIWIIEKKERKNAKSNRPK